MTRVSPGKVASRRASSRNISSFWLEEILFSLICCPPTNTCLFFFHCQRAYTLFVPPTIIITHVMMANPTASSCQAYHYHINLTNSLPIEGRGPYYKDVFTEE